MGLSADAAGDEDSKGKGTRSRSANLSACAIIAVGVAFCFNPALVSAQEWSSYVNVEDGFAVLTPGELQIEEISYPSEYGAVFPARVYSYEDDRRRFSITVVDYTDAQRIHAARTNRTEADYIDLYWEIDVRASVAYAAWNLRKNAHEVTYDAYHYIDRVEGHQLHIENEDRSRTYAAIYLHDSRLYILEATVPPGAPPPTMFQQSLEFVDEDGSRIRYDSFAEAVKVRDAPVHD